MAFGKILCLLQVAPTVFGERKTAGAEEKIFRSPPFLQVKILHIKEMDPGSEAGMTRKNMKKYYYKNRACEFWRN